MAYLLYIALGLSNFGTLFNPGDICIGHTPGCGEPYGSFKISYYAILSQVE